DALQARWDAADRRTALIAAGSLAGVLVVAAVAALLVAGDGTPDAPPARISVTPAGEEAPRLGPVVIAFREPPASTETERLVTIERAPAAAVAGSGASVAAVADGTYAWLDDRTLLFQPDFPGFQRGAQYLVRVDGDAAGGGADFTQEFTVEGKLTVRSVIPGAADQDVPSEARIFVQFSRSVAPLTVLAEQSTDAVIEFEPALPGSGEWLNTSLYVFTPDDLQPSTTYRGRIAAGLTSAADGALEEDFEWEFSTFQPALASSTPADSVSFVPPDATVELVFNQPMDRASTEAGVDLLRPDASRVAVDAAWSEGDTTLTLTPREPLSISTRYSVRVDEGIAGAAGGATQAERTFSFTTVDMPEVLSISP
ncbi:MAG: Ig-like domain-containing protein, partial [Dehalococcoidia bacterium]